MAVTVGERSTVTSRTGLAGKGCRFPKAIWTRLGVCCRYATYLSAYPLPTRSFDSQL